MALLVELVGSLALVGYVVAVLLALLRGPPEERLDQARRLIADGVIASLSFKVAGSLLKLLEVQTWNQIGLFAATLALRTLLKRFFTWERARLRHSKVLLGTGVAPFLNLIEGVWKTLKGFLMPRRSYNSLAELETAVLVALNAIGARFI